MILYIAVMLTATMSSFRKEMKKYLDQVIEGFETLVIHRGNDEGIVVMSLKEYNSLSATHHELASKVNEERLDAAIRELNGGGGEERGLIEE